MSVSNINPPSLDLAYEWVKDVLDKQSNTADVLDTKATNLFTVASLILGIGISAGILALEKVNIPAYTLGGLSLIGYSFVATFTFFAWSLRSYETLDNPVIIREWYWDMEPTQFKVELLSHLEGAFANNESKLNKKAKAIRVIIVATTFEILSLVLALALTL